MGAVEGGGESPKAPRYEAHGTSRSDTIKKESATGTPTALQFAAGNPFGGAMLVTPPNPLFPSLRSIT